MGYEWRKFDPDLHAQLDEHGGEKEKRDQRLWDELEAECTAAVRKIATDPKYADLTLHVDWAEVE
jgi:hypothetical protein